MCSAGCSTHWLPCSRICTDAGRGKLRACGLQGLSHGHVPTSGIRQGSGVDVPDAAEIALHVTPCMATRLHPVYLH